MKFSDVVLTFGQKKKKIGFTIIWSPILMFNISFWAKGLIFQGFQN